MKSRENFIYFPQGITLDAASKIQQLLMSISKVLRSKLKATRGGGAGGAGGAIAPPSFGVLLSKFLGICEKKILLLTVAPP